MSEMGKFVFLIHFSLLTLFFCSNSFACPTSKEFITTYRYLESTSAFQASIKDKVAAAKKVAHYCEGAADRFVRVVETLLKAGLVSQQAFEIGLKQAALPKQNVDAFLVIFKESFLEKYLDLDLGNAIKLAQISTEMQDVEAKVLRSYFQKIVRFCVDDQSMGLPKPLCAKFAKTMLPLAQNNPKKIQKDFKRLSSFLLSQEVGVAVKEERLKIMVRVIGAGENAADNFITAYQFANSSGGLNLSNDQALEFAIALVDIGAKKTNLN